MLVELFAKGHASLTEHDRARAVIRIEKCNQKLVSRLKFDYGWGFEWKWFLLSVSCCQMTLLIRDLVSVQLLC